MIISRRENGSVIILVLTVMGLIMAMALTLYYQNQSSKFVQQTAESRLRAELAFREACDARVRGEQAKGAVGDLPSTSPALAIHGEDSEGKLEVTAVNKLENESSGLRRRLFQGAAYAALAPNGSVSLESINSWINPVAGSTEPLTQFSGRSVWIGAKERITVEESLSYAELHSMGSDLEVDARGNYILFERSEYQNYDEMLEEDIESARSALTARTTNKTSLFVGKLSMGQVTNLVTKGNYRGLQFLSLQQALRWPFFTFPTVKSKGKALDIRIHVPLMADGVDFSSDTDLGGSAPTGPSQRIVDDVAHMERQIQYLEWLLRHDINEKPPEKPAYKRMDWLPTLPSYPIVDPRSNPHAVYNNLPKDGTPSQTMQSAWEGIFEDEDLPLGAGDQVEDDVEVEFDPDTDLGDETLPPEDLEDGFEFEEPDMEEELESEEPISEGGWYVWADRISGVHQEYQKLKSALWELDAGQRTDPPALSQDDYAAQHEVLQAQLETIETRGKRAKVSLYQTPFEDASPPHMFDQNQGILKVVESLENLLNLYKRRHKIGLGILEASIKDTPASSGTVEGPNRKKERELIADKKLNNQKGYDGTAYGRVVKLVWASLRAVVKDALKSFPMKTIKIRLGFKTIKIIVPAFWKIPSWLRGIGKSIVNKLRKLVERHACLVHLGEGPLAAFEDSGNIQLSTFTVPRGRSHAIRQNQNGSKVNVTVVGDLWIQRGASLWLEGNLFVQSPAKTNQNWGSLGKEVAELLKPSGRIILEEGATLIVDGTLTANRVVTTAPPGEVHVITSGILCEGNVSINHGTRSAVVLDEIADAAGLDNLAKAFKIYFQDIAPNLSKLTLPKPEKKNRRLLTGPFHSRAAYFTQYPIILRVILPGGPVYPTFEKKGQNANTLIFRAFANFFAVHLNLTIGENFSTYSDWWIFGRGRVPVFPKILRKSHLEKAGSILSNIKSGLGDLAKAKFLDTIRGLASNGFNSFLKDFFTKKVPNVIVKLAKAALSPAGSVPTSLPEIALSNLGTGNVSTSDFLDSGKRLAELFQGGGGETNWAHHLLPESAGVFIYAGRNLKIGTGLGSDLAAGFFVANGDVTIDCPTTVGTLVSLNGQISAERLLAYEPFSQVSLYLPKKLSGATANPTGALTLWQNAVTRYKYGDRADRGDSIRIPSKPLYRTLWQGANR